MVGLHRVGIVGLRQALSDLEAAHLENEHDAIDFLVERLGQDNYIPESELEDYRTALRREVLRHRGEDFSAYLSTVEVTVHGDPGDTRDRFVEQLRTVFAEFELRPEINLSGPLDDGRHPLVRTGEHEILRGLQSLPATRLAIRKSFSGW
jgi:hypothetical protein